MNKKRNLLLFSFLMSMSSVFGFNFKPNSACSDYVLDAIEIHESHFGCLDAETNNELYNLLMEICDTGINI